MSGAGGSRRWPAADAVLALGALLLFVDSFLHWERICVSVVRVAPICVDFWTAWSGRGAFPGTLMALLSAVLVLWQGALVVIRLGAGPVWLRSALGKWSDRRQSAISVGLATATMVFGVVKLAFVVSDHSTYGSYVAVPLLVLIAAGAAMRSRESSRSG